jgi:putative acetyltransferase
MKLIIRQIEERDNLILARIIRGVFDEHNAPHEGTVYSDPTTDNLYELFQSPGSVLWVAEINGEIVGCCGIYHTGGLDRNCVELVKFYLKKEARGHGTGKELMQKSIESAREFGFTKIYLESLPQFSKAVNMYEKLGFTMLDHPLGNSGHRTCHIWMLKELEPA